MDKRFGYLKNAELTQEGNYNMVGDGLLNNIPTPGDDLTDGQTYEEIRNLAPETLPEEKQSILDHLHQMREQTVSQQASSPSRGNDSEERIL